MVPLCTHVKIGTITVTTEATKTTTRKDALLVLPASIKLEKVCSTNQVIKPTTTSTRSKLSQFSWTFLSLYPTRQKMWNLLHRNTALRWGKNPIQPTIPWWARYIQLEGLPDTKNLSRPSNAQPTGMTHLRRHFQFATTREAALYDIRWTKPTVSADSKLTTDKSAQLEHLLCQVS